MRPLARKTPGSAAGDRTAPQSLLEKTIAPITTSLPTTGWSPKRREESQSSHWLFPGLGCRYVGMGSDIIGRFATADRVVAQAGEILGYDVAAVCLEGSGRKVVPSRQEAQVIYVIECAYADVLRELGHRPRAVCGHSLGAWGAAYAAGLYDMPTGLRLVSFVEDLLEQVAVGEPQGMGVVLGLEAAMIQRLLTDHPGTYHANWNSPLQHVVSGPAHQVDALLEAARQFPVKQARRLNAQRALHTPWMAGLLPPLRAELQAVVWRPPQCPFVSSHDGAWLRSIEAIQELLATFLTLPVGWQQTIQRLATATQRSFVEAGPGNLLSTMMTFIDSQVAIRTATELIDAQVNA
ncbi:MAG: ACP S-malonyltransferase [Planctomycetales bacterium]